MFIRIPKEGAHLNAKGIVAVEEEMDAKYMGAWTIKGRDGWLERPVDVFYVAEPDTEQGHSNYFGVYRPYPGSVAICNAESAFKNALNAVVSDSGEVHISRFRHDYIDDGTVMIDGGRDYCRHRGDLYQVEVKNGDFTLEGKPVDIVR